MSPQEARIVLVDDDPDQLRLMTFALEFAGHTVVQTYGSKREAMASFPLFSSLGIQVVILDGNTEPGSSGGVDGYEMSQEVKRVAPGVIVVTLSADDVPGGDPHIAKPIDLETFGPQISKLE
jgi:DNA-binding NtrC family response regulator